MKGSAESPADAPPKLVSLLARFRTSALAIVIANLAPIYGVFALGWNAAAIVIFYWLENPIIGFFNILRMRRAQGSVEAVRMTLNGRPVTEASRNALIVFFAIHYGFFTLGHGVFVLVLFGRQFKGSPRDLGIAALALAFSHGISYRKNFIGQEEYKRVSFASLFWRPYGRIIVMHLTLILGGFLAESRGWPEAALIMLVALKTLVDLASHLAERRKFLRAG
jgi:Family of unknown function (DUF6498)